MYLLGLYTPLFPLLPNHHVRVSKRGIVFQKIYSLELQHQKQCTKSKIPNICGWTKIEVEKLFQKIRLDYEKNYISKKYIFFQKSFILYWKMIIDKFLSYRLSFLSDWFDNLSTEFFFSQNFPYKKISNGIWTNVASN